MLELSIDLAAEGPIDEDMVTKFAEHFYCIAAGMNRSGADGMWDEEDGLYYDLLRLPDGSATRLKVRSMVGLPPEEGLYLSAVMHLREARKQFLSAEQRAVLYLDPPDHRPAPLDHGRPRQG